MLELGWHYTFVGMFLQRFLGFAATAFLRQMPSAPVQRARGYTMNDNFSVTFDAMELHNSDTQVLRL